MLWYLLLTISLAILLWILHRYKRAYQDQLTITNMYYNFALWHTKPKEFGKMIVSWLPSMDIPNKKKRIILATFGLSLSTISSLLVDDFSIEDADQRRESMTVEKKAIEQVALAVKKYREDANLEADRLRDRIEREAQL